MATTTIQCDVNNDIAMPDGRNVVLITGAVACAQNMQQKSLMRLGEDEYNVNDGVDYFGTIFTPQPNYDAARSSIATNLLRCPDVISIESITIVIDGDKFQYEADVNTVYGTLPSSS